MERETFYFNVKVDLKNSGIETDEILELNDEHCRREKRLVFDKVDDDGKLSFIFVTKSCRNEKEAFAELDTLKDSCGEFMEIELIRNEELSNLQKQKIRYVSKDSYYRECGRKWSARSRKQVLEDVKALFGNDEYKQFIKEVDCYLQNLHKRLQRGNCNVLFVYEEKGDINEDMIRNDIYDLYVAYDVIKDYVYEEYDLCHFSHREFNTPCMIEIKGLSENADRMFRRNIDLNDTFREIVQSAPIKIAFISKEDYEKNEKQANFSTLFAHKCFFTVMSKENKLKYLETTVQPYGFTLDTSFSESKVLEKPLEELKVEMMVLVTRALYKEQVSSIIYPQDLIKVLSEEQKEEKSDNDSAMPELEKLIGLQSVKKTVQEIATFLQKRGKDALPCLHMVFRGNPGTGKTTVARLIGKIFAEIGILKKEGKFIETDRKGLVGMFVGHTAMKTSKIIDDAQGGVLFIDEAYSLNQEDCYSKEAIATLVKRLEDDRKNFICIMAGYSEEMNSLLDVNPGLRERIQFYIDFPDYTAEELTQVFRNYCEQEDYKLTQEASVLLTAAFAEIISCNSKNFANARVARKIFERVRIKQAFRTNADEILPQDVEAALIEQDLQIMTSKVKTRKIGFAV